MFPIRQFIATYDQTMLFSKKVVDTQPPGEELGSYIDEDWEEFSSEYVGHPPNKEDETLELAVVNFLYGKSKPRSQHRTPIKHKGSTTHQIVHLRELILQTTTTFPFARLRTTNFTSKLVVMNDYTEK